MSKPVEPQERCAARIGFYGTACQNRHLPGASFCGVHKGQEQGHRDRLAASRARRTAARAERELVKIEAKPTVVPSLK